MQRIRHASLYAGLASLPICMTPTTASALTLEDVSGLFVHIPTLAMGFAAGVLLTSVVFYRQTNCARHTDSKEYLGTEYFGRHFKDEVDIVSDIKSASGTPVQADTKKTEDSDFAAAIPTNSSEGLPSEPLDNTGFSAEDLTEIAQNYVKDLTFKERMAKKAKGVASILRERMAAREDQDAPIIERAPAVDASLIGDMSPSCSDTSGMHEQGFVSPAPSTFAPSSAALTSADITSTASTTLNQTNYPQTNLSNNVSKLSIPSLDDEWAQALRSLDAKNHEQQIMHNSVRALEASAHPPVILTSFTEEQLMVRLDELDEPMDHRKTASTDLSAANLGAAITYEHNALSESDESTKTNKLHELDVDLAAHKANEQGFNPSISEPQNLEQNLKPQNLEQQLSERAASILDTHSFLRLLEGGTGSFSSYAVKQAEAPKTFGAHTSDAAIAKHQAPSSHNAVLLQDGTVYYAKHFKPGNPLVAAVADQTVLADHANEAQLIDAEARSTQANRAQMSGKQTSAANSHESGDEVEVSDVRALLEAKQA